MISALSHLKKSLPTQVAKTCFYAFLWELYNFNFYNGVWNLSKITVFCICCKWSLSFVFFPNRYPVVLAPLKKKFFFPIESFRHLREKSMDYKYISILGLFIWFHWSICLSLGQCHLSWFLKLYSKSWNHSDRAPTLFFIRVSWHF